NTAADIAADPHVLSRDFIVETDTPEHHVRVVANPIAFLDSPPSTDVATASPRWPLLGEGTDRVLRERLDLDDVQLAHLRQTGVIQ
ncbi:MAG: CoA transferase, partial [Acidimicrobiales bacterium]